VTGLREIPGRSHANHACAKNHDLHARLPLYELAMKISRPQRNFLVKSAGHSLLTRHFFFICDNCSKILS
jgi:hypothetical protein